MSKHKTGKKGQRVDADRHILPPYEIGRPNGTKLTFAVLSFAANCQKYGDFLNSKGVR